MKEIKDIDRLFQEQLKDFEATPNEQVWKNVAAELNNDKKKRRIIPLWWKYSGVAAALLLGLFAIKTMGTKEIVFPENPVVNKIIPEKTRSTPTNENSVNDEKKTAIILTKSDKKATKSTYNVSKSPLFSNSKTTEKLAELGSKTDNATPEESLVNNLPQKQNDTTENQFVTKVKKQLKTDPLDKNSAIVSSLETATKIATETNELEEILKQKTENKNDLVVNTKRKWQIIPNVAPVYLQTNSAGSSIDNQFSNNDKSAETSLSFGLGIHYALTSKLTIRSGINKVALDYNTNDIVYSPSLVTNTIASINYKPNNAIEVQSKAESNAVVAGMSSIQKTENGAINQRMGYYELPMEVSYAILDKKIGVSLIGGFSTLFLSQNKISLVSSTSNVDLGEANNLNKIHISSNFGVGFKYQLVPALQFHFEPMVKYQWNTFSSTSDDFKPVFLGLYSGVSYRF